MTDSASRAPTALAAIAVTGTDSAAFLRAQLTNDVMRLGSDRHFLAAWCDAKGRAQMIARVCERGDGYLLLVPAELIDSLMKRLQMFVLRAAVELHDCRNTLEITARIGGDLPAPDHAIWHDDAGLLGLPSTASGEPRALEITPADHNSSAQGLATNDMRWLVHDIDAGLPSLTVETQGQFVPQMLNLHWLKAIDFDKGCYPGQEVIARLHYRGRLTRRMFRLSWSGSMPAPGEDILDATGERAGTVLIAATSTTDKTGVLLAVLKTSASTTPLSTGSAELELTELPYPTPD